MDALKAEIASKRKILQDDPVISLRPTKYMRRGDIERLKEEQELKLREENERREEENTKAAGKKAADQKVGIYLFPLFPSSLTRRWRIGLFEVLE